MFGRMGPINGTADGLTNASCSCNCQRSASYQSMAITELEFVQILVIVVVMMMMVVVITCLLNHYRLSAQSFVSRHAQTHRRHLPLTSDSSLWSSDGLGSSSRANEVYTPRLPDQLPHYMQRDHPTRFQPTYPHLSHIIIDLPPNIPLSDGEEPPPYQGPCTLQLRDPEQQLELNRESVRAPPNRTVFDSPLSNASLCPPSANAGISGASLDCTPPAYSEVIGHYFHPSSLSHHTQTAPGTGVGLPHLLVQGDLRFSQINTDSRSTHSKAKHKAQQV